jgi:hypothetical protein
MKYYIATLLLLNSLAISGLLAPQTERACFDKRTILIRSPVDFATAESLH